MDQNQKPLTRGEMEAMLLRCFPRSFFTERGEFIAHKKSNTYMVIDNCETKQDLDVAVIEWLSRAAYKTEPYYSAAANRKFHRFMLDGVNKFLGTDFTYDNMDLIYTYLGNAVHHKLAVQFVESGFCLDLLVDYAARKAAERK